MANNRDVFIPSFLVIQTIWCFYQIKKLMKELVVKFMLWDYAWQGRGQPASCQQRWVQIQVQNKTKTQPLLRGGTCNLNPGLSPKENTVSYCGWIEIAVAQVNLKSTTNQASTIFIFPPPHAGNRNFWVGMCHWDPGTLSLYQSLFSRILLPYTRINSHQLPSKLRFLTVNNIQLCFMIAIYRHFADFIFLYSWVGISGFLSLDKIFKRLVSFVKNDTLF